MKVLVAIKIKSELSKIMYISSDDKQNHPSVGWKSLDIASLYNPIQSKIRKIIINFPAPWYC